MSQSSIVRFPHHPGKSHDNDPEAAAHARQRIASLPSQYLAHAAPSKEDLVGVVHPNSPAAEHESRQPKADRSPSLQSNSTIATSTMTITNAQPTPRIIPGPARTPIAPTAAPEPPKASANPLEQATTATSAKTPPKVTKPERETNTKRGRIPTQAKPLITAAVTFCLLFLLFKAPIVIHEISFLTQPKADQAAPAGHAATTIVPPDPVISIPKINVNAPVVYADNNAEAAIQKDLESGVVHYARTANPGENGNAVIFGHSSNDWWEPGNYKFVFVLLDKLQNGDTFTVNYQSKQYIYQVYNTKVVEPTDLSVVAPTADPQMTLITCTPPGTSWKRLVVQARQISPSANTTPAAPTQTPNLGQDGALPGSSSTGITNTIGNWWESLMHRLGVGVQ